ncbi:ATP-binding protein [soil metagenome]
METKVTKEHLRAFDTFADVPDEDLQWLVCNSRHYTIIKDGYLFKAGDATDEMHIIISGKLLLYFNQNGQRRVAGEMEAGEITGTLPYSRMVQATGNGVALEHTEVLSLHRDHFRDMMVDHHGLTQKLVTLMATRVKEFTKFQSQNEKMISLGKLSAGLAHELNNPAAAIVRSAGELKKHLGNVPDKFKRVMLINITPEIVDCVNDILFRKMSDKKDLRLSMLERREKEDDITYWMEDHDIENGAELAENFAEFGFELQDLDVLLDCIGEQDLAPVLAWLDNVMATEKLVGEIEEASKRISALVGSVKSYSHMDRASDTETVDIHEGIRSTITLLNHKIKKNGVKVIENFDTSLPKVPLFVSEMNQVYTNLIDNAIDAMEGREGNTLEIATKQERDSAVISIIDNGPGIPEDLIDQIFDPFFTTKAVGKGSGLGLDLVRRIVEQHKGTVKVYSKPGRTEFRVCVPML